MAKVRRVHDKKIIVSRSAKIPKVVSNFTTYTRGLVPLLIVDGVLSAFTLVYVVLFRGELQHLFRWTNSSPSSGATSAMCPSCP